MPPSPEVDAHGLSDRGLVRQANGDHFLIAHLARSVVVDQTSLDVEDSTRLTSRRPGYLFLVADGLGDTPDAERASALAVDGLLRYALNTMPWFFRLEDYEEDVLDELKRGIDKCRERIELEVEENPSRRGMGTSLVLAYVLWPRLYVLQVGSPRALLARGGRLERLTTRVLPEVIAAGSEELHPEVYRATLEAGDLLLLATDGLARQVPEPEVSRILSTSPSARDACAALVDAANEGGGTDNVAVVVARFLKPGEAPPPAPALRAEVDAANVVP